MDARLPRGSMRGYAADGPNWRGAARTIDAAIALLKEAAGIAPLTVAEQSRVAEEQERRGRGFFRSFSPVLDLPELGEIELAQAAAEGE